VHGFHGLLIPRVLVACTRASTAHRRDFKVVRFCTLLSPCADKLGSSITANSSHSVVRMQNQLYESSSPWGAVVVS